MKIDPQKHCIDYNEHRGWAMLHDIIAHPLMALTNYSKLSINIHDYTSKKAWNRKQKNS